MSILEIKGLTHTFDGRLLFDNADLTVNNGEHIGVVGLNGAGKSTFINIIAGRTPQDAGEVLWQSNIVKGYLDQHADIDRSLTVMEYLKTAFTRLYEMNARMEALYAKMSEPGADLDGLIDKANRLLERLTDAGFFDLDAEIKKVANGLGVGRYGYDTPVAELSGGMRAKLMLTKLLLLKPDIMLLDEPTNFLDIEHIDWLADYLNGWKGTFMVISHDTDFLNRVSRFVVSIQNGSIKKIQRQLRSVCRAGRNELEAVRRKLRAPAAGNRAHGGLHQPQQGEGVHGGHGQRAQEAAGKARAYQKPTVVYDATFSFPCAPLHTREIAAARGLVIGYGEPLLPPLDFSLPGDGRLWIRGTNGVGKTTLIKTLIGAIPALGGSYAFHPFVKIGYLEQDLVFPDPENNAMAHFNARFPRYDTKKTRAALAATGIKNDLATKPISALSGGEQVRIKLTVLCHTESNLLILDEPTNHLDVRAKAALKKALLAYPGAIILVSHEKDFAGEICDRVFDVRM